MYSYEERVRAVQLYIKYGRSAAAIIRERYADFGPTLACEKLWECQYPRAVQRLQDRGFSHDILTASRQPLAVLLATSDQVMLVARRLRISLA